MPPRTLPTRLGGPTRTLADIQAEQAALLEAMTAARRQRSIPGGGDIAHAVAAAFAPLEVALLKRRETEVAGEMAAARTRQQEQLRQLGSAVGFSPEQQAIYDQLVTDNPAAAQQIAAQVALREPERVDPLALARLGLEQERVGLEQRRVQLAEREAQQGPTTALMQNVAAATGARPGTAEFEQAMQAALTRPETAVTFAAPDKLQEERAKSVVRREDSIVEERADLQRQKQTYRLMQDLFDRGLETGFGPEWLADVGRVSQSFGVEIGDQSGVAALRALSTQAQLNAQRDLKGQTSDREQVMLRALVPNVGLTTQANKDLVALLTGLNERRQEELDAEARFIRRHGYMPTLQEFRDFYKPSKPIVPPAVENRILEAQANAGLIPGAVAAEMPDFSGLSLQEIAKEVRQSITSGDRQRQAALRAELERRTKGSR